MSRRSFFPLILALAAVAPVARGQVVTGDVSAVGFRAATTSGFVARAGQWVPIQVQLMVQGSRVFQGQLSFESRDLDGDLVSYVEAPIALNADAGLQRAWCYVVWPIETGGGPRALSVDILTDEGLPVATLPLNQAPDLIHNDTLLVLDISAKPLTRLRALQTPSWSPWDDGFGVRPYHRNVVISTMETRDLPDRWIGLEAVDVLIWDEPDPASIGNNQLRALLEWVENGGQLIVGLGGRWTAVEGTALAEVLPVRSRSGAAPGSLPPTIEVSRLGEFFRQFAVPHPATPPEQRTFASPIAVSTVAAAPGALRAVRSLTDRGVPVDLITVGYYGSGRVTVVAALLRDLLTVPVEDSLYGQLLGLAPTNEDFRSSEQGLTMQLMGGVRRLYDGVTEPVDFTGWSSVLVAAAFAFVVSYIGIATLLSWWWLQHQKLAQLNWTVFAVAAIVAGTLSLGAVGVLRGVSRGVRTMSFVDLAEGEQAARVYGYFGYSTASRGESDLALPDEDGFLRPLAPSPAGTSTYATPRRYAAISGDALLRDAPRRATLKQFEGFSRAEVRGGVRAQIVVDRTTGQITPGSWIVSDLDVPLRDGYLLFIDPRFRDDDYPTQPAGKTTNYRKEPVTVAANVLAVRLPELRPGERINSLGAEQYRTVLRMFQQWQQSANRRRRDRPDLVTLWEEQQFWLGQRSPVGPPRLLDSSSREALLASMSGLYLHSDQEGAKTNNMPLSTDGLMPLDVSHWLMQGPLKAPAGRDADLLGGQAVLLAFAADPGPVRLLADRTALGPVAGRTMYRVRVPIQFEGRPPIPVAEDGEP